MIDGEPWFVAREVCTVLGLTNPTLAIRPLDDGEKVLKRIKSPGGAQITNLISESGLYKLIMRSDKPQAKPFQDWVTREVLPSIRKTGAYVVGQAPIATQSSDPLAFAEMQMNAMGAMFAAMKEVQRTFLVYVN